MGRLSIDQRLADRCRMSALCIGCAVPVCLVSCRVASCCRSEVLLRASGSALPVENAGQHSRGHGRVPGDPHLDTIFAP